MVSGGDAARKRIRDYSAERARRNKLAQSQGFTSLDQRAKAIRAGEFPTFRARRTDPVEADRAQRITANRKASQQGKGLSSLGMSDDELDRANRRWARAHARQDGTRYRGEWSRERREGFYRAFVQWWRIPHDERDFGPTYEYMHAWPEGFQYTHDENPYN